jgi:hypothetical protein
MLKDQMMTRSQKRFTPPDLVKRVISQVSQMSLEMQYLIQTQEKTYRSFASIAWMAYRLRALKWITVKSFKLCM